jgi:hypothetical protein
MGAQKKLPDQFRALCRLAVQLAKAEEADGLFVLLDCPTDWQALKKLTGKQSVLVAADLAE